MIGDDHKNDLIRRILRHLIKGPARDLWWTFYGFSIHQPGLLKNKQSVLFICKGNVCRSPFAEHIAKKISGSEGRNLIFGSAGLRVDRANPAPFEAIEVAEKFGVDITGHLSSMLTHEQIESFDAIFTMEAWQLKKLQADYFRHSKKIFLLPLMGIGMGKKVRGYQKYNIRDPYGGTSQEFIDCFKRIEMCVRNVLFQGCAN